jgi:DNA replication and repair protein RecF
VPFLSLSCVNYRNLANETIDLLAREVFFVGENGQGKSNLLEALYYLSYGVSFRTHSDGECVKQGEGGFSLRGMFRGEQSSEGQAGATHLISVYLEKGKKRIEKNAKKILDRKELINTIPCVLYCHEDLEFVNGEPERRRFFIDQTLSMHDLMFIDISRQYKRALKSRNTFLKVQKRDVAEAYNPQLAKWGVEMQRKRKNVIFSFNRVFSPLYEEVTGIDDVHLVYAPSWKEADGLAITEDAAIAQLAVKLPLDMQMGTTLCGPHRDRIIFMRRDAPFIPTASTGQRRLAAILLRTAQGLFYRNLSEKKPVLLMDDVLLELDPEKRQRVTSLLPEYDQLFCTFLIGEPHEKYQTSGTKVYRIADGRWEG